MLDTGCSYSFPFLRVLNCKTKFHLEVEFSFAIEIYSANSIRYLDSTAMHDRIINGARSGLFIRNITQLIYAF